MTRRSECAKQRAPVIHPQFPDGAQVEAERRGSSRSERTDATATDDQYAQELFPLTVSFLLGAALIRSRWVDFGAAVTPIFFFFQHDKSLTLKKMMLRSARAFSCNVVDPSVCVSGQSSFAK